MRNKLTHSDLIFLSKNSDNMVITNWLEDLEKIIKENPNDSVLGEKIRKL